MLYPINLDLEKMKITVIGGGAVAYRKVSNYLSFNKSVTVVAKSFIEEFDSIREQVTLIEDEYKQEYIEDSFIVVAATDNKEINHEIGVYCLNKGKLVNVVDDKELSNFTVPSYVRRGDLLLSVSTGGNSPSLSKKIKKELEEKYDESYGEYIELLGKARAKILKENKDKVERRKQIKELLNLTIKELKEKI